MNNMTAKNVNSEYSIRTAKSNKMLLVIGSVLLLTGVILLAVKSFSPEYIDAAGVLHESFWLIPLGFLSAFCGLIAFLAVGVRTVVEKIKSIHC